MKPLNPFLELIPYGITTAGTQILILVTLGEDQEQPLPHRCRHLAAGAKERGGLKVLIVRLTCHRLKHNAEQDVRQDVRPCTDPIYPLIPLSDTISDAVCSKKVTSSSRYILCIIRPYYP
jgi:hypothetical protein